MKIKIEDELFKNLPSEMRNQSKFLIQFKKKKKMGMVGYKIKTGCNPIQVTTPPPPKKALHIVLNGRNIYFKIFGNLKLYTF